MEPFNRYTSHHASSNKTPYVTLYVCTSETYTREPDESESLDSFGVALGAGTNGRDYGKDKCLTEAHIGFMPAVGDTVYLVIEVYGEGCTFGHTRPCYRPAKVFKTKADAEAWIDSPEGEACKDTDYFGGHDEYLIEAVEVES